MAQKLVGYIIATNRLNLVKLLEANRIPEFSGNVIQFIVTNQNPEFERKFDIDKKKVRIPIDGSSAPPSSSMAAALKIGTASYAMAFESSATPST